MRLGVLGGSFNPPHIGHLLIASDAHETLGLDRLVIVPAFANPLKGIGASAASAAQRLEMVRLTFGDDARFEVTSMEIDRGGLSFTVDTLETIAGSNPEAELVLLVGFDSLATMDKWKQPDRIRELARLAAIWRGEGPTMEVERLGVEIVTSRRVDVSSSEIRERLAKGRSIRGFVAESVERYITAAKLYAPRADG